MPEDVGDSVLHSLLMLFGIGTYNLDLYGFCS
jgi:hypothetical protein